MHFYFAASEIGCSFCWIPCSINHVGNMLEKQEGKHMTSFVGDLLPS